jgi:cell division septum initiation protein DivIVA
MGAEPSPALAEILKKKRGRRFASVRRGLDTTQVDEFLVTISSRIEALETELRQAGSSEGAKDAPPPPPEEGEGSGDATGRIARLAAVGEREIDTMLGEANAEAATIATEARGQADRIRAEARAEARRSVEEARGFLTQVEADAGTMLSGVAQRRREMMEELERMQERLLAVAEQLDHLLDPSGG